MSDGTPAGAIRALHITLSPDEGRIILWGYPGADNPDHSCDANGCPSVGPHVLAVYDAAPVMAQLKEPMSAERRIAEWEAQQATPDVSP